MEQRPDLIEYARQLKELLTGLEDRVKTKYERASRKSLSFVPIEEIPRLSRKFGAIQVLTEETFRQQDIATISRTVDQIETAIMLRLLRCRPRPTKYHLAIYLSSFSEYVWKPGVNEIQIRVTLRLEKVPREKGITSPAGNKDD